MDDHDGELPRLPDRVDPHPFNAQPRAGDYLAPARAASQARGTRVVAGHLGGAPLGMHLPRCAREYVAGFQQ
jgi:hypothetical protein